MGPGHAHKASGQRSAKPLEDRVAILVAVFGLVGGIVLHLTVRTPVITGWFFGTGVASLTYGCLGGIRAASFRLGPFKVGGSLAALAGVAYITTQQLQAQLDREEQVAAARHEQIRKAIDVPVEGRYEWQWAGDGWIAHITVAADGITHVDDMVKFATCGGKRQTLPLAEQQRNGSATLVNDGLKLRISIPVRFIQYDGCDRKGLDGQETVLTGELDRKAAYAGVIQYGSGHPGDMILVKNYGSARHDWSGAQ